MRLLNQQQIIRNKIKCKETEIDIMKEMKIKSQKI